MKPGEEAVAQWNKPWNLQDPIESMFVELEELFVQFVIAGVLYSQT